MENTNMNTNNNTVNVKELETQFNKAHQLLLFFTENYKAIKKEYNLANKELIAELEKKENLKKDKENNLCRYIEQLENDLQIASYQLEASKENQDLALYNLFLWNIKEGYEQFKNTPISHKKFNEIWKVGEYKYRFIYKGFSCVYNTCKNDLNLERFIHDTKKLHEPYIQHAKYKTVYTTKTQIKTAVNTAVKRKEKINKLIKQIEEIEKNNNSKSNLQSLNINHNLSYSFVGKEGM